MEFFSWIFFGPAKLIALWPYAGVSIAGVFIALQAGLSWRANKPFDQGFFRAAAVFAGILWIIFNAFELQMSAVLAKSGGGTLRLDLIVLVPILYVLSTAAVLSLLKQTRTRVNTGQGDSKQED